MRVDPYSQVGMIYSTTAKTNVAKTNKTFERDRLELSQVAKDMSIARKAVAAAPDIREDKVAEVKAKYQAGAYDFSAEELAQKLADKYGTMF